jgi:hypothetical protein
VAGGGGVRPPYDTAVRLHLIAREHWDSIDGRCAAEGVDPFQLPPHRFCNLIYAWALERVEDAAKFDAELAMPLPGRARRPASVTDSRRATDDLMSFGAWARSMQTGG